MKLSNLTLFSFILLSFYDVQSDEVIFNDAKSDLELESPYIDVIYNKDKVSEICPKYSIGCYLSKDGGYILISDEIPSNHHDVVLYGLYSDYLQHNNSGLINDVLTCDLKVNYLNENQKHELARLYSGQCDSLFRNKVIVMN
jgi:hypothetical protein|tara:strand:+ start:59 stop:484 length:426 start_codon:yes stop_codon:yes gene_type:complete